MTQRPGNHGVIIPRDRGLLVRLYVDEDMSGPEIARMFGVTHKSLYAVFRKLDIPRRKGGGRNKCVECGAPVHKTRHATNGSLYGKRCAEHQRLFRKFVCARYNKTPVVKAGRKALFRRWYYEGPLNPQGELQWLSKGRALLRAAKRITQPRYTRHPEVSTSQSVESRPASTSRT